MLNFTLGYVLIGFVLFLFMFFLEKKNRPGLFELSFCLVIWPLIVPLATYVTIRKIRKK